MRNLTAHIDRLEASGEILTRAEWIEWIEKEAKDYGGEITDGEMDFILGKLEQDGYVSYLLDRAIYMQMLAR